MAIAPQTTEKLERLTAALESKGRVLVALSGGVDSTLCMKIAHDTLGYERAFAVTAKSETLTPDEFEGICELARQQGWNHHSIEYSELAIPHYAENPVNRCFFCKHELYTRLAELAQEWGCSCVIEGTNADDRGDYRPGMKAAAQIGTFAPLLECDVTKAEIREMAKHFGLPNWSKPSGACLSSRFPYGKTITREGLDRVAAAEDYLHELGFTQVRVRYHDNLARIEVVPEELPRFFEDSLNVKVASRLREIGFLYISVDLVGYRTGSMNEVMTAPMVAEYSTQRR
ncbi:MAG: ATP-dependent sacrificial sulfur transferase LarE [Candidatus Sumerlaeaceae bacterium]